MTEEQAKEFLKHMKDMSYSLEGIRNELTKQTKAMNGIDEWQGYIRAILSDINDILEIRL